MTPLDRTIAFQALHESSRTIHARLEADPLRAASVALDTAIRTIGQFDDIIVAANQKQNELNQLTEQVTAAQKRRDDLAAETRNLEDSKEALKAEACRWESVLKDMQTQVFAKNLQQHQST